MTTLFGNLLLALFLTGLIWTIQLVHYPLMARVAAADLPAYCLSHQRSITPLVLLSMTAELLLAVALVAAPPAGVPGWAVWLAGALLGVVWLSTALLQVPLHGRLAAGDASALAPLVATNWLRTAAWTARSLLLAWLVWRVLPG